MRFPIVVSFLLTVLLSAPAFASELLVSLPPLGLIAEDVVGDKVDVQLLLPPNVDAHQWQLRPSDWRRLQQAERVFWLGAELEPQLAKVMAQRKAQGRDDIAWVDLPNMILIEGEGGIGEQGDDYSDDSGDEHSETHEEHQHDVHEHAHNDSHNHDGVDMHVWLSQANVEAAAKALAQQYQQDIVVMLDQWRQQLEAQQKAARIYQSSAFLVSHDAWRYWTSDLGLSGMLAVDDAPDQSAGVKRWLILREQVQQKNIRCALVEPNDSEQRWNTIFNGQVFQKVQQDPLARDQQGRSYLEWRAALWQTLEACLQDSAE